MTAPHFDFEEDGERANAEIIEGLSHLGPTHRKLCRELTRLIAVHLTDIKGGPVDDLVLVGALLDDMARLDSQDPNACYLGRGSVNVLLAVIDALSKDKVPADFPSFFCLYLYARLDRAVNDPTIWDEFRNGTAKNIPWRLAEALEPYVGKLGSFEALQLYHDLNEGLIAEEEAAESEESQTTVEKTIIPRATRGGEPRALDIYNVCIEVFDRVATLSFARAKRLPTPDELLEERALGYENFIAPEKEIVRYIQSAQLDALALTYNDLLNCVETQGAINKNGWCWVNAKIARAVEQHPDVVHALFAGA